MAYALFTRNYDITLRNLDVTISNKWTGVPAVILESPTGGIKSTQGTAKLDNLANLNVYIDTSQEWTVTVMGGQPLTYNILDPKQIVNITELNTLVPEIGKTYVLDQPPYPEYVWDGETLIKSLSSSERYLVESLAIPQIGNVTFNLEGKIESYERSGILHTVTYPDANTIVISNTTGVSRTVYLNGAGSVTSII